MKLLDYIRSDRRGREAARLERRALDDPFLREAMEGYERVKADHARIVRTLEERILEAASVRRSARMQRLWAAAAMVAIVLGGATLYFSLRMPPDRLVADVPTPSAQPQPQPQPQPAVQPDSASAAPACGPASDEKAPSQERRPDRAQPVAKDEPITEHEIAFTEYDEEIEIAGSAPPVARKVPVTQSTTGQERAAVAQEGVVEITAEFGMKRIRRADTVAEPLRGRVVDGQGRPLAGATVLRRGTQSAVGTAPDGSFSLPYDERERPVEVMMLGYRSAIVDGRSGGSPALVRLEEDTASASGVVVVAFGAGDSATRSPYTGSPPRSAPVARPSKGLDAPEGLAAGEFRVEASPVGGVEAFEAYLSQHRIPQFDSLGRRITGRVGLAFRIDRKGRAVRIRVTESLSPGADAEAIRLLREGPRWEPARGRAALVVRFE